MSAVTRVVERLRSDYVLRVAFAFLVAPMTAPLLFVLGTNIDAARLRQGVDFAADATVLTIGIPVAYVTALIVGVPAFFILRTIGRLGLMGCLATGAIAGILPVRLLLLRTTDASTYAIGAGLGLCSACVFWAVGVRRRRAANAVDEQPE